MPPSRRAVARPLSAIALAALAACSGDDAPSAPANATLDVDGLLSEMASLPSVTVVGTGLAVVPVRGPAITASCAYAAASQSFVCPPVTESGLTFTAAYVLLDAAGRPQAEPNAATTAAVRTVTTVKGTLTLPATSGTAGTMTLDQRQELTLSGLLTRTRRLDGTGTMRVEGTTNVGASRVPLSLNSTQTVTGLLIPSVSSGPRWPTAGTITTETSSPEVVPGGAPVRMVVTFNGTSTAAVALTIGGRTQQCTVNLAGGSGLPVCTG